MSIVNDLMITTPRLYVYNELLLDKVKTPKLALSLDKLRSLYNGYCIRVRRSTDNAVMDIGFKINDLNIRQLLSFINGNNGYIVRWYRQDETGGYVEQTDTTRQPIIVENGVYLGGIRFDNITPKPSLNAGTLPEFSTVGAATLYGNLENLLSSNGRIFDKGDKKLFWIGNGNDVQYYVTASGDGFWKTSSTINNDTQYDIMLTTTGLTGNTPSIYFNNSSQSITTNSNLTTPVTDDSSDDLIIGNRSAEDRPFVGLMNRLVCYDRVVSESERSRFSNFPYTPKNNGIQPTIILLFDDGGVSVNDEVMPYISGKNIKINTAPVQDWVGTSGVYNGGRDFMSLAQLQSIYALGHDIVSHSKSHPDFTTLNQSQIETELTSMQTYLNDNSMPRGADYLVVPFNKTDADYFAAANATGIKMARGDGSAGEKVCLNPKIDNWHNVGYLYSPGQTTSVSDMEAIVDEVIKYNIQCTIMLHYVVAAPSDNTEISITAFQGLIDYLVTKSSEVRTMTMSEWYDEQNG